MKNFLKKVSTQAFAPFFDQYEKELEKEIVGSCDSLLDVGCGAQSPIRFFSKKIALTIGVDGHSPSIEKSRTAGIHQEYHVMQALEIEKKFPKKFVDCVLLSDVIEHLSKEEGLRLAAMAESLARKKVIIFTPNGFLPQGEFDHNPYQVHVSGWTVAEMRGLGYHVLGINGWKPLRGEFADIAWKPKAIWGKVSLLSQKLVTNHPQHAFQILCVKELT